MSGFYLAMFVLPAGILALAAFLARRARLRGRPDGSDAGPGS